LVIHLNGSPAGYSDHVVELIEVGGVIYQENMAGGWWSWTNGSWVSTSNPTAACADGGSGSRVLANYPTNKVTGVQYGPDSQFNLMDYAYPVGAPSPLPVMVYVHGGGWFQGTRTQFESVGIVPQSGLITQWASYGLFVATIDYRLTPTPWPAMIVDVRLALRYLRQNAATLHIDPSRICVGGDSPGGELSQLAGYLPAGIQSYDLQQYTSQASNAQCVVDMFGPEGGPPGPFGSTGHGPPDSDPLLYLAAGGGPPTWITQGNVDGLVTPNNSITLYNALAQLGIQRGYFQYTGDHEFSGDPTTGPASATAAYSDEAAFVLRFFGLPSGNLDTSSQLPACGASLNTSTTPSLGACFSSGH
jgi:acetyl esterase/lipase